MDMDQGDTGGAAAQPGSGLGCYVAVFCLPCICCRPICADRGGQPSGRALIADGDTIELSGQRIGLKASTRRS